MGVLKLPILLLFLALPACVEFNAECSPPIESPDEIISHLASDVPVARAQVRTSENPLANAMTDGYLRALSSFELPPVVAIENAGAIRDQGLCTTRTVLSRGPLTRKVLREVLPFSNELVVVEITERQLFDVLEHGVGTLAVGLNPGGQFLQVAGLSYEVDCSQPAERLANEGGDVVREARGQRVRAITVGDRRIERGQESTTTTIAVAVNEFIAGGGDNFLDFKDRPSRPTGFFTYTVVEDHLRRLGPSAEQAASLPLDDQKPRISLVNCE